MFCWTKTRTFGSTRNLLFVEQKFSNDLDYENAAKIRDQISGLKLLTESQKISIPDSSINRDIFGIVSEKIEACTIMNFQ